MSAFGISEAEMDPKHETLRRNGSRILLGKRVAQTRITLQAMEQVPLSNSLLLRYPRGLDFITALGYGDDPRLKDALALMRKKMRSDGKWLLDAINPDLEGAMKQWYEKNPKRKPIPFALEKPGKPSKMITLRAMQVLRRIGKTN